MQVHTLGTHAHTHEVIVYSIHMHTVIFLLTEAKTAGLLLVASLYSKRALPGT